MIRIALAAGAACVLSAAPLHAQPTTDTTIVKSTLTLEGARRAIAGAGTYARANHAPGGVIAVVDDGGNLIALERLDGTFSAGANISIGKARTSAMFKKPTRVFEEIIRNGRTPMVALSDFTPLQGGVPIEIDGQIVGAIGVSGAASAQQDEELAMAGAAAVAATGGRPPAAAPAGPRGDATHFDRSMVGAAFAAGATLYDGGASPGGVDCSVNASRRDGPGRAEVHRGEADIMYIVSGTATLVTGGRVSDAAATTADEVRGTGIEGGAARAIGPGDVVVVPAGVPHWFREVPGPLEYLVVKVRPTGQMAAEATAAPSTTR